MTQPMSNPSRLSGSACALISVLAGLALPAMAQVSAAPQSIKWNSGVTEVVRVMNPAQTENQLNRLSQSAPKPHVIVHFLNALTKADHERLAANGLLLQSPLGGHSYFATVLGDMKSAEIARAGAISVTQITRNRKLHQDLAQGLIRPWMVRENVAGGNAELQEMLDSGLVLSEEFADRGLVPMIAVLVMFHKDEAYQPESKRLAKALGATITSEIYTVNTVTMHLPMSKIDKLANDDSVQWIEPPLPPMDDVNAENRVLTGTDTLNASPYDLDGTGISVLVYDSGTVKPHPGFGTRLTIGASEFDEGGYHATHVAGTIGGDGELSFGAPSQIEHSPHETTR